MKGSDDLNPGWERLPIDSVIEVDEFHSFIGSERLADVGKIERSIGA
jgi:hypothetical protein